MFSALAGLGPTPIEENFYFDRGFPSTALGAGVYPPGTLPSPSVVPSTATCFCSTTCVQSKGLVC